MTLDRKHPFARGVPIGVPKSLATDDEVREQIRILGEQIKFLAEAIGHTNANVKVTMDNIAAVANAHEGLVGYLQQTGVLPLDGAEGEEIVQ